MDLVLHLADEYVLDSVWAHILPVSAFAATVNSTILNKVSSLNASYPILSSTPSAWSQLISHIPHPPLSNEILLSPAVNDMPLISAWPRDYMPRQIVSLFFLTLVGIHALYFSFAWLSYRFIFNHDMMKHPRFLKNQVKLEIMCSLKAFPGMILLTLPWFVAEVRGHSKLYTDVDEYGWPFFIASIFLYVFAPC
jgi:Delta7-sterol 5-desaturase